jgi:hypothetical protein
MNLVSFEDMAATKALPDEVAAGHARRLTFLNECPSARHFDDTVRIKIGGPMRPHAYPEVCLLPRLNNQSVATYTSKHTMLPFTCFPLTRGCPRGRHSCPCEPTVWRWQLQYRIQRRTRLLFCLSKN